MKSSPYEPALKTKGGFPGVIGLIDGTHIRIRAPEDDPDAYIKQKKVLLVECAGNRKAGIHKYNLIEIDNTMNSSHGTIYLLPQLVCDNNMIFTDVLAGWPGSVHDSRVLCNSELFHTAVNKFPGDGGYPLLRCASVKTTAELPDLLIVALSTPYLTVFGVHLMLMKLPYTVCYAFASKRLLLFEFQI